MFDDWTNLGNIGGENTSDEKSVILSQVAV